MTMTMNSESARGDGMARPPHYAPRSRYRTRPSGAEMDVVDDFAATALDRPVIEVEVQRARSADRASRAKRPTNELAIGIAVVVLAALLGVFVGMVLALS